MAPWARGMQDHDSAKRPIDELASVKGKTREERMISKNRATWLGAAAAIAVAVLAPAEAAAQEAIKVVSHRYPALEYYAKAMEGALPGTKVEVSLMPQDKSV